MKFLKYISILLIVSCSSKQTKDMCVGKPDIINDSLSIELLSIELKNVNYTVATKSKDTVQFYYPHEISVSFEVENSLKRICFQESKTIINFDTLYSIGYLQADSMKIPLIVKDLTKLNNTLSKSYESSLKPEENYSHYFQVSLVSNVPLFESFKSREEIKKFLIEIEYGQFLFWLTDSTNKCEYNYIPKESNLQIKYFLDYHEIPLDSIALISYDHLVSSQITDYHFGSW